MTLTLGPVGRPEYLEFIERQPASFLQCPSWAEVKHLWSADHLGWRDEQGSLVGVALVLYRAFPLVGRSLAYVPEGPVVDWAAHAPRDVLGPLIAHVRARGAIALRIGPELPVRRWHAETLKAAVGPGKRLADVPADVTDPVAELLLKELAGTGWVRGGEHDGLYGSTMHSLRVELAGRTEQDVLRGMNQQWRRAIRKAEKAGVVVEIGGLDDLGDFYRLYAETARRDGFKPQTPEHFQRAWRALSAEAPGRIRLYLGRHEGEVLAAMLVVTVGDVAGYAYGGSASHRREVYPSNAVHWRIIRDLLAEGVTHYDLRGMADVLDPDHPGFGLVRFKLGTGGDAVELIGDWDLPLRPLLFRAFTAALPLRPAAAALRGRLRRVVRR
jgi:lipid II:glycine glycyltransferase (peptidoglycan interpeptide bridge formation enzyme)